ncbi:MAG: hypothetical protein IKN17_05795 [Ruminococcus sp.]|nr:hypothetical protein [Ruminococcus sp.]
MALGRKKKEESTNDKIIRLFQEGKSVEDIVGEVALRADIVTGVIQRKLGADAVPDAAVQHERSQAASIIGAATGAPEPAPAPAEPEPEETVDGMSKLERYMFEKKKKMESAPAEPAAPAAPGLGEMEGISLTSEPEPAPEPEPEPASTSLFSEEPKEPEVHRVSLVDDYKKQMQAKDNIPSSRSEMDGISLTEPNVPPAPSVPSYTVPSPGEEYAEMDALVPPDVESTDISDAPILSYSGEPEASAEDETSSAASAESESPSDKASKAADKMKAFALSQIEANNQKIAELENRASYIRNEFTAKIDDANMALTVSQSNYDTVESRLADAYAESERAREEHNIAIAQADDDYRRKLAVLDEEYKAATFEANKRFQELDDKNRETISQLDDEKAAAQADLVAKRKAVADIQSEIDGEGEKLKAQISALKEENEGYQAFLG